MSSIGIDVGSSNVKVVVVDGDGDLVGAATRPLRTAHDGPTVTQEPAQIWTAISSAIDELGSTTRGAVADVTDIGVCSQYSSMVVVDGSGVPVSPIIMYMDRRGTDLCWQIMERHPDAFETFVERHGIPPIGAGLTLSHILAYEAEVNGEAGDAPAGPLHYLELMDFVNLLLTGTVTATQATMFASQLIDNRTVGTTSYDQRLVEMAGVNSARLPPLSNLGSIVGEVRAQVARSLGLPDGIRVHAGMNDTHAGAFATGVLSSDQQSPHSVGVMIGTTAVVIDSADGHKVDLEREVLTMPSPIAGRHLVMAENGLAGRSVQKFFELMGIDAFGDSDSRSDSRSEGGSADAIESALSQSDPGAAGLIFMPWLDGSMSPLANASVRGGLIGLGLTHTREDLVRAALEGTAFNLGWLLPAVEELTGRRSERVVFGGGAARSLPWAQVLSDVLQRPVEVLSRPEISAATSVARVAQLSAAGADLTSLRPTVTSTLEPNAKHGELYRSMQEQFEVTFSNTRGICEALGHG